MANLGLTEKADTNMRALSGGMKRRVLVAQALVHKPPVIILDEPTAGVDVELRQTLWKFIRRLNRDGHTIVLTTHYLEEAEELCSRIAMLKAGQVVALDTTTALLKRVAGSQLKVRLSNSAAILPPALEAIRIVAEPPYTVFRINQPQEIEPILATLRQAQCALDEVHLQQTDLEDVFLQIMGNESPQ
jgi:ABC-2 type transport system ATP-binding protein